MRTKLPKKVPLFICVGRNYYKHAEEMNSPIEQDPVIFFKPATSFTSQKEVLIPQSLGLLHYEVELTVLIKDNGKYIERNDAIDHIWGYGIGIDFTLRELQNTFKEKRLPWELSKGFDNSAYISEFIEKSEFPNIKNVEIELRQNGKIVQRSNTNKMIFSSERIIEFVSKFITIKKNYVIMTGTPVGVGPIEHGDILTLKLGDLLEKKIKIIRK